MVQFTVTKYFDAAPEIAFQYASDLARAADRIEGIAKLELLTDGPVGVGTRFRETRIMFKREATEEMEITKFDPPRSYEVEANSHGCHYHTVYTFTPEGQGTEVTLVFNAHALTMTARIMSFVMAPLMRSAMRCIEADLDDLAKAVVEEGAAVSADR